MHRETLLGGGAPALLTPGPGVADAVASAVLRMAEEDSTLAARLGRGAAEELLLAPAPGAEPALLLAREGAVESCPARSLWE